VSHPFPTYTGSVLPQEGRADHSNAVSFETFLTNFGEFPF
jgi:hypothetical protein